jgi:hypothetical protein
MHPPVSKNATPEKLRVRAVSPEGELHHVSASQLKTFRACNRKWYFEKVLRVVDSTSTVARDGGTALHAEQEQWYSGGSLPTNPLARTGIEHLPVRTPGMGTEVPLVAPVLRSLDSIPWEGSIDLLIPPVLMPSTETDSLWIIDHKTTSDFKYAFSSVQLQSDLQVNVYAYWSVLRYFGTPGLLNPAVSVRVSHAVYLTRPEKLKKGQSPFRLTSASIPAPSLIPFWEGVEGTVESMVRVARAKSLSEVAPDATQKECWAYGGCPYRVQCESSSRLTTQSAVGNSSVLHRIRSTTPPESHSQ